MQNCILLSNAELACILREAKDEIRRRIYAAKGNAATIIQGQEMAKRAMETYGRPIDTNPVDALLDEVRWTAGHVASLRDRVRELEQERTLTEPERVMKERLRAEAAEARYADLARYHHECGPANGCPIRRWRGLSGRRSCATCSAARTAGSMTGSRTRRCGLGRIRRWVSGTRTARNCPAGSSLMS